MAKIDSQFRIQTVELIGWNNNKRNNYALLSRNFKNFYKKTYKGADWLLNTYDVQLNAPFIVFPFVFSRYLSWNNFQEI